MQPVLEDIRVTISEHDGTVRKRSLTQSGRRRLVWESCVLDYLAESPHTPKLIETDHDDESYSVTTEYIDGKNLKEVLGVDEEWQCQSHDWGEVKPILGAIAVAQMDLIQSGCMHRDISLEHVVFRNDNEAVLVDHETTVVCAKEDSFWYFNDQHGTWETMAPEEFRGRGYLNEQAATYRLAVLSHLALTGSLPFPRFPLRHDVHMWRKRHVPRISRELFKPTRQVLRSALDVQPAKRQKNPTALIKALDASYQS